MKCQQCKRDMVQLFTSCRCDWCDFGPKQDDVHRGYAVRCGSCEGREHYVCRTLIDASKLLDAFGESANPVVEVRSLEPFRWRMGGSSSTSNIVLADARYEVFPDHRYEPMPHRAFIAPRKE